MNVHNAKYRIPQGERQGRSSHHYIADPMNALPDLPFVSRGKLIHRDGAALPRIVIVNDDQSATYDTIGKVIQDAPRGIVPVRDCQELTWGC